MACAVAANDWSTLRDAAAHERDATTRWRNESAKRLRARSTPPVADDRTRDAAERVATSLTHPWPLVVSAVERATPAHVRWLALSHAAAESALRLEGEANDVAQALAVVDRLAMEPGWSAVVLIRLAVGDGADAAKLRFEITARLDARAIAKGAS
jgi:hypothetical protein